MSSKNSSRRNKILFICTHNSARSQMAEGLVNYFFKDTWIAESAGTEKTSVKTLAIESLKEIGIDISHHKSKAIDSFKDQMFDVVVTVCDSAKEACPFFPGKIVIHAPFTDPSDYIGSHDEELGAFNKTRDCIQQWLANNLPELDKQIRKSHGTQDQRKQY